MDHRAPVVGIIPYALRPRGGLAGIPLSALHWPLGAPQDVSGAVRDLGAQDHVLVHPNLRLHFAPWGRIRAKVSLLIAEPSAIHRKHVHMLTLSHRRFHAILTRDPMALARFDRARLFVTGATMLDPADRPEVDKTENVSLIASSKRDLEGHKLRHALVERLRANGTPVAVMGHGYAPFEDKADGLEPYRYSVIIENVQEPSMFTEKLIDACLCRTVPIYWGAPDIGRWFNRDGMIICNDLDALEAAVAGASAADYAPRRAAIEENRQLALSYADTDRRAATLLLSGQAETPPYP